MMMVADDKYKLTLHDFAKLTTGALEVKLNLVERLVQIRDQVNAVFHTQ